jgi:hypothetical protein
MPFEPKQTSEGQAAAPGRSDSAVRSSVRLAVCERVAMTQWSSWHVANSSVADEKCGALRPDSTVEALSRSDDQVAHHHRG